MFDCLQVGPSQAQLQQLLQAAQAQEGSFLQQMRAPNAHSGSQLPSQTGQQQAHTAQASHLSFPSADLAGQKRKAEIEQANLLLSKPFELCYWQQSVVAEAQAQ